MIVKNGHGMVGRAMEQSTFAELEHDSKKRRTRREVFLEKMDGLIPWGRLEARIEPFYPEGWARSPTVPARDDAARALRAIVLQRERPGDGGSALRGGVGAALCRVAAVGTAAPTRRRS